MGDERMSKYSKREALGISFALTGGIFVFGFGVVGILMVIWWYIEYLMEDDAALTMNLVFLIYWFILYKVVRTLEEKGEEEDQYHP